MDRLILAARFEKYLIWRYPGVATPCTAREAAERIGWGQHAVVKRCENIRERYARLGVPGLRGPRALEELATLLISTGELTANDLWRLPAQKLPPRTIKMARAQNFLAGHPTGTGRTRQQHADDQCAGHGGQSPASALIPGVVSEPSVPASRLPSWAPPAPTTKSAGHDPAAQRFRGDLLQDGAAEHDRERVGRARQASRVRVSHSERASAKPANAPPQMVTVISMARPGRARCRSGPDSAALTRPPARSRP